MVAQTIAFIQELKPEHTCRPTMAGFKQGEFYAQESDSALLYYKAFSSAKELFSYDLSLIYDLVRELELHTDVNLTVARISYLADAGSGPKVPLLIAERQPIARGIGFEIEERGIAAASLGASHLSLTDKANMAQNYYSSGLSLMALEDQISGLIDAAFMQFYLAVETILGAHEQGKAIDNGKTLYAGAFVPAIESAVKHVYLARHRFFGHAHVRWRKGQLDKDVAFSIAKQALVARWCARALIALETGADLVHREMRLYSDHGRSVEFNGDSTLLVGEFALPK